MFKKLLLTSALLATFASAHAQSSQNFGVTGTVSPAPCNVTLTGGTVNLGTLSQATVKGYIVVSNTNNFYQMSPVNATINIVCSAATKVQVSFIDNKSNKNLALDGIDIVRFGLTNSTAGTIAIGAYQINFTNTTIDGAIPTVYLSAPNGTSNWSTKTAGTAFTANLVAPGFANGFAKTAGAMVPDAITTLSGNLTFQAYLGKDYVDGATSILTPAGSGTLTLTYL